MLQIIKLREVKLAQLFLSGSCILSGECAWSFIEATAICRSYAACMHPQIDPAVVFHEHGYRGLSKALLFTFGLGVFPGV
ncbi:MAG: hypothetical protein ABI646_09870, partial [Acidobacteriota bacterium]